MFSNDDPTEIRCHCTAYSAVMQALPSPNVYGGFSPQSVADSTSIGIDLV